MLYLLRLPAHCRAISTVGDKVLTVIPQQAVRDGADELLGPAGYVLVVEGFAAHLAVRVVHQDLGAVRKVLERVHPHCRALVHAAQDEPLVGDDGADELLVAGEHREDVRDEVGDPVLAQVDAVVGEDGPGNLQQVPPAEKEQRRGRGGAATLRAMTLLLPLFLALRPAGVEQSEFADEGEFLHQECQQLQHGERLDGNYPHFPPVS